MKHLKPRKMNWRKKKLAKVPLRKGKLRCPKWPKPKVGVSAIQRE